MSITISTQPSNSVRHAAYSNEGINYSVTSNDSNNVQVKCEILVDGALADTIIHDVDLGASTYSFDVQRIVQDNLGGIDSTASLDLPAVDKDGVIEADSIHKDVQCKFYEITQVGNTVTEATASVSSNTIKVLDAVWQMEDTKSFADYEGTNADEKWLTNFPRPEPNAFAGAKWPHPKRVGIDESEFLYSIAGNGDGDTITLRFEKFDFAGASQGTINTGAVSSYDMMACGVGPANVNALSSGWLDSTIWYYEVHLIKSNAFEEFYYVIDHNCYENSTRFFFKNKFGAYDSITFIGQHSEGLDVTSSDARQVLGSNSVLGDRGRFDNIIASIDKKTVSSGILREDEIIWLKELYDSPLVYVQENGNYTPIIITNKSAWSLQRQNNQPLTVEYITATDRISQRN